MTQALGCAVAGAVACAIALLPVVNGGCAGDNDVSMLGIWEGPGTCNGPSRCAANWAIKVRTKVSKGAAAIGQTPLLPGPTAWSRPV